MPVTVRQLPYQDLKFKHELGQNDSHLTDDMLKCMYTKEKFCVFIRISLKFVPRGLINNKSALVQEMAWRPQSASHYLNQGWHIDAAPGGDELTHEQGGIQIQPSHVNHRVQIQMSLTHSGRDKMADIFQTTFSNAFSWMYIYIYKDRYILYILSPPYNIVI